jgi:hypothetical protein
MAKRKQKSIEYIIAEDREWLTREIIQDIHRDSPLREIQQYFQDGVWNVGLGRYSHWLGVNGLVQILDGQPSGSQLLANSLGFKAWDQRLLIQRLMTGEAQSIMLDDAIFAFFHAFSSQVDEIANWLGAQFESFAKQPKRKIRGWLHLPVFRLAMHLYSLWKTGKRSELIGHDPNNPYENLIDAWFHGEDYSNCLISICDYHVKMAWDTHPNEPLDFFRPVYGLYPVEILAIMRLRSMMNLQNPTFDHELMRPSYATLPSIRQSPNDPLLEKIVLKTCEQYKLTDPWTVD